MKVEITSASVEQFSFQGKDYQSQTGYIQIGTEPYPQKMRFTVDRPLPPGDYILDVENTLTVRNGKLQVGRIQLIRVMVEEAKPVAAVK